MAAEIKVEPDSKVEADINMESEKEKTVDIKIEPLSDEETVSEARTDCVEITDDSKEIEGKQDIQMEADNDYVWCEWDCCKPCCQSVPRVIPGWLHKFKGVMVTIVGEMVHYDAATRTAHFMAANKASFAVHISDKSWDDQKYGENRFVEIRGVVQTESLIEQHGYHGFGKEFNLVTWEKFVQLTATFPNIF